MIRRLLIVPRWGGGPSTDFYATLSNALDLPVDCLDPGPPEHARWVPSVREALVDPEHTLVLGHSVGFRAARMALSGGPPVAGLIGVAAWETVDAPWPTLLPWIGPIDAPARAGFQHALISNDDPFTSDWRSTGEALLGAGFTVEIVPGARHFNRADEPDVLRAVRARI